ncbi:hypothetical protein ACOZZ3_003408 [Cronobacter dublinensis]
MGKRSASTVLASGRDGCFVVVAIGLAVGVPGENGVIFPGTVGWVSAASSPFWHQDATAALSSSLSVWRLECRVQTALSSQER